MYCPVCFDQSLTIRASGKGFLALNGKQLSTAIFLFNVDKQTSEEIHESLEEKIDEIFKWYTGFENAKTIEKFEIFSSEYDCDNGCAIPASSKISLVGPLINRDIYLKILHKIASKYALKVDLEDQRI